MTATKNIQYHQKTHSRLNYISRKTKHSSSKHFKFNKKNINHLLQPSLCERFLCCSCYFTFGLSGLLYILFNFFTTKSTNNFTTLHTLQSIAFGIITAISVFTIKAISVICLTILPLLSLNISIQGSFLPSLEIITFCLASLLSLSCLSNKFLILPGINNIAKRIIN